jgi:lambda family phage tail tape measure protein
VTAAKDAEADKQKQMLYVATLISGEYARQQQFSIQQLITRGLMNNATTDEKRIHEAINQQLEATSKKIDDINKLREAAIGRGGDAKVLAEYDAQIIKVQELGDAYAKTAENFITWQIAQERTFMYGWNKAFKQFAEDAENYGKLGEQSFTAVTSNMSSAIDKFVESGKFSFNSFAESVIKDLIKIQLRMQMMQLFSMAKGGLGSLFGMGGSGGFTNEAGGMELAGSLGFAEGGDPPVGVPSLVGERGAELFVPKRAGTIIPNNQLNSVLNGGQTINYNAPYIANMQAIDTQSGIQFLAKNKLTIWSMNQSANRSIPAGR